MAAEYSEMTQPQIDEFLQAPRHGIFATNRIDGPPQITAMWYLYEDEKIYLGIYADSAKYFSIRRDPRVSLCVDGGHPDARAVTIYGTAELIRDSAALPDDIFFRITRRYVESDEEAKELNNEVATDADSVLVVVTPSKVFARDYN